MTEKNMSLMEKVMTEGKPFQLLLSTTDNTTTEKTFVLDTDDYDIDGDNVDETTPFKDKILFITGYNLIADTNIVLDYFALDDEVIVDGGKEGYGANQDLYVDGSSRGTGATNYNYPTLKDKHGLWALICRGEIAIKASATGVGEGLDLYIKGYYLDREH